MARKRRKNPQRGLTGSPPPWPRVDPFTEDGRRAYVPAADDVLVTSLWAAQRVAEVRTGFVRALVRDPRVIERFNTWLERLNAVGTKKTSANLTFRDILPVVRDELRLWPWCLFALLTAFHRMVSLKTIDLEQVVPAADAFVPAPGG